MSEDLGKAIKKLRNKEGLTQSELADKIGKTRGFIANLEGNIYNPSLDTLRDIAKALNVETSHIFLLAEYR